jgi:hypothetical protein
MTPSRGVGSRLEAGGVQARQTAEHEQREDRRDRVDAEPSSADGLLAGNGLFPAAVARADVADATWRLARELLAFGAIGSPDEGRLEEAPDA